MIVDSRFVMGKLSDNRKFNQTSPQAHSILTLNLIAKFNSNKIKSNETNSIHLHSLDFFFLLFLTLWLNLFSKSFDKIVSSNINKNEI